jgi:signal transduction histidine kinase
VTLAWIFDIPVLRIIYPGGAAMKFSTSISFIAAGIAVYFIVELLTSSRKKLAAVSQLVLPPAILITTLFMSAHITSAILGGSSGIDNLFVKEAQNTPYTSIPGRPAIATILSFVLIATTGMAALRKSPSMKKMFSSIGLAIGAIGGVATLGYALAIPAFYYAINEVSNGMAIHTAILFVVIGSTLVMLPRVQKQILGMQYATAEKPNERERIMSGLSIRTKFTSILLTVTLIPILFVGGITLNNAASLPSELLAGSVAILGFATAVSVTFFALSLSNSLLRPLLSLKHGIHEVASGNYSADIRIDSTDEIGALAEDFRYMKRIIVETNNNLERLVNERTAELQTSKKQLEIVVAQLKEQERVMKNFISIAAHELKNPVAPILMASQIFAKREVDSKITLTKAELDLILQNALRLKRLCENILDVASMENNGLKLEKRKFSLTELVQESITNLEPTVKSGVDILFTGQDQTVEADHDKVQQVLQNILQNAIKFTSEGLIQISLSSNSNCELVVRVKDTGNGIDPDILPILFSKYATKSEKGTGLGLYISKNIIEAHGGKIWAENNADKGATFAFSLPVENVAIHETAGTA